MHCRTKQTAAHKPITYHRMRLIFSTLLALQFLLVCGSRLHAQGHMVNTALVLQVRPEELLKDNNGSVLLKIRLARGSSAQLWAADSCGSPTAYGTVINASGTYTIPYDSLRLESTDPAGRSQVCLASSDGILHDSLPLQVAAQGNGTNPPSLANMNTYAKYISAIRALRPVFTVPGVVTLTTKGRTTTWSKP